MSEEHWDKESVCDKQVSPLMTKIIAICKEHKMPIVCSVQYCDTEESGVGSCTTTITKFDGRTENDRMRRLNIAMQPERPFALAETIITKPDGSKEIRIRRV